MLMWKIYSLFFDGAPLPLQPEREMEGEVASPPFLLSTSERGGRTAVHIQALSLPNISFE
jgi:hypothetical protein